MDSALQRLKVASNFDSQGSKLESRVEFLNAALTALAEDRFSFPQYRRELLQLATKRAESDLVLPDSSLSDKPSITCTSRISQLLESPEPPKQTKP